ncbi:MAG: hypothetical protein ACOC0A_00280, partial [Planctomycetota bacterium]
QKTSPSGRRLTVTLLVEPEQAQALQLGEQRGMLTLAMRNPFDSAPITARALNLREVLMGMPSKDLPAASQGQSASEASAQTAQWNVMVIRGNATQTETFDVSTVKTKSFSTTTASGSN